jgi:hypothetical protein
MKLLLVFGAGALVLAVSRGRGQLAGASAKPTPLERATQAAIDAVTSGDPKKIRALAVELRAQGQTDLANRLEQAAVLVERMLSQPHASWPAGADPVDDPELRDPPPVPPSQDDLMVAAWLRAKDTGAPALVDADLKPNKHLRRPLTARERWFLGPYFPVAADLKTPILNFRLPPGTSTKAAADTMRQYYALTFYSPAKVPLVYFPHGPQSLLSRWWMAVLAHELVHGAQLRLGMTPAQTTDALVSYGYALSPIEVQARFLQRVVYGDLVKRAHAYFASRGPVPVF